jgi:hypothetical protein
MAHSSRSLQKIGGSFANSVSSSMGCQKGYTDAMHGESEFVCVNLAISGDLAGVEDCRNHNCRLNWGINKQGGLFTNHS